MKEAKCQAKTRQPTDETWQSIEQRERSRIKVIVFDVLKYMKHTPIKDDFDEVKGYAITFEFPAEARARFDALAAEHNRTPKQLMEEYMEIYFQEAQRIRDERN